MSNLKLQNLRIENKSLKTENEYLKGKIAYLYAEIVRIAKYTVPVDCMPKES